MADVYPRNFLGGMLAADEIQQRRQAQELQQVMGLASLLQRQQEAQQRAQLAPLQMDLMRSQVEEAQRKSANARAVDEAISKLPSDQQPLARMAPQQFVTGQFKTGLEGAPEIVKLQAHAKRLRDAGRIDEANQVDAVISNKEMGGTSQHERAYRTLLGFQRAVNSGQQLTPEQELEAQAARSILGRQEMRIDPVTKEPYFVQPITIPGAISVGGGYGSPGAGRVNAVPPLSQGRAPIDAASEKELHMMADARNMASDLKGSFKEDFGGFASDIVGNAVVEFGRRFGDKVGEGKTQDMAKFWETYEQWITDMRKEKFGVTLTDNELAQFERLRAKPSQSPSQIKNNLARQLQLVEQAMGRRMTALARQGVNQSAIEGAVGWGVERPNSLVNPSAPKEKQVKRTGTLNGRRVIEYTDGTVEVQ